MNCIFISIVGLILGFFLYGSFVDRVFGPDPKAKMPTLCKYEGVDFTPMSAWELFT
jgi:carbon starvation protein CstA